MAAALSNQKPRSRREAIHHPSPDVTYEIRVGGDEDDDCDVLPPPLGNQYLEFNDLDVITTDEDGKRYRGLTPRDLKARAKSKGECCLTYDQVEGDSQNENNNQHQLGSVTMA